jgi:hypothetical protein
VEVEEEVVVLELTVLLLEGEVGAKCMGVAGG